MSHSIPRLFDVVPFLSSQTFVPRFPPGPSAAGATHNASRRKPAAGLYAGDDTGSSGANSRGARDDKSTRFEPDSEHRGDASRRGGVGSLHRVGAESDDFPKNKQALPGVGGPGPRRDSNRGGGGREGQDRTTRGGGGTGKETRENTRRTSRANPRRIWIPFRKVRIGPFPNPDTVCPYKTDTFFIYRKRCKTPSRVWATSR